MDFKDIISDLKILRALEDQGFKTPTPIQEQAIPVIMEGNDIRACAQTGTGKTAAFLLPILSRVCNSPSSHGPKALILVPTRELAMQVAQEAVKLSRHHKQIVTVCLYGGVPYQVQYRQLSKKYDILIATPGRLIDHIGQKKIRLDALEVFVLDEADRMLDMGFIEDVEHVASLMPKTRQTLMFSATYGKKVIRLAETLLKDPVDVKTESESRNHEKIEQKLHRTNSLEHKYELLNQILSEPSINQAIVFASTKMQVDEIADTLRDQGFKAAPLHGDMNQHKRSRTMLQMREGKIKVLVATDVAARGIDVLTITHVINFDLPNNLEDYIHRIGRTGRAGSAGIALSFVSNRDHGLKREIERFAGLTPTASSPSEEKSYGKKKEFKNFHKKKFSKPYRSFSSRGRAKQNRS